MGDLRIVDFKKKHFECGGKKFYVQDSISFARYRELQKIILEFSYSATFVDLFKQINKAWEYMNNLKFGDAAVTLHNLMMGIKNLESKDDAALRMCALFMNEEGEDPTLYEESKMREKIDCWAKELDVSPFFRFAANTVPSWIAAFRIVSRNGSPREQKQESTQSQTA